MESLLAQVTTPRASTTVSAATSALGIADMSDLASVELGHRNPADRPTEVWLLPVDGIRDDGFSAVSRTFFENLLRLMQSGL